MVRHDGTARSRPSNELKMVAVRRRDNGLTLSAGRTLDEGLRT